MEAQQLRLSGVVWRTTAACLLAPMALALASVVIGGAWFLVNYALTIMRPGILGFFAAVIGAGTGMYTARYACDTLLAGYKQKAVFIVLAALMIAAAVGEILSGFEWIRLGSYAQIVVVLGLAYTLFWRADDL